jgi:hypothetical protein
MARLPRFVVNERDANGGDREDAAEEASSSESEQDEEADVTDVDEEDSVSEAEPEPEAGASGRLTALPRSVPEAETPRARLTIKLKKQRASDEVCSAGSLTRFLRLGPCREDAMHAMR